MNLSFEELLELSATVGWRVSPIATALTFSAEEGERPRFETAPHLELISDAIVDAIHGEGKKFLAVSMPPRHGKSTLVTRRVPQWFLANHPEKTVGMCGYGGNFASGWGRVVRNEMRRHATKLGFNLAEDSKRANTWHTDQGGGMWTAGIRGEITGKGADLLIIDDPIKNEQEAFSLVERDGLWEWWQGTALTRTYPHSVVIVVMTRWHTDDFVGRLLSREYPGDPDDWRVIDLPAVWESDEPDAIGRRRGDALWPSKFSADFLLKQRKAKMSEEFWASLYQQQPLNRTGLGAAYHAFEEAAHVRPVTRDERLPLCWSLDFNVNPMSAVLAQVRETLTPLSHLTNEKMIEFEILDEIVLPHSNTPEMCAEFLERRRVLERGRGGQVHVYGDATANRRDTRGADSDWEIVYRFLRDNGVSFKTFVQKTDPLVRNRVNSVNANLRSADGQVRMRIDPRCKELRLDLKEVRWKRDAAGNSTSQLDKGDPKRTHVSDALGYLVHARAGIMAGGGERPEHF